MAERDLHIDAPKEVPAKSVGPARTRQAVEQILHLGMCPEHGTCEWFGLSRSALNRPLKLNSEHSELLRKRIIELSLE